MENFSFKDLNIENLRDAAEKWADQFPALKELTLYSGNSKHGGAKYVFVAIYDDLEVDLESTLSYYNLSVRDFSPEEVLCIFHSESMRFLNWQWESCIHIQEALPNFYKPNNPESRYLYRWGWYSIPVGQPLALDDFICKSPVVKLFPYPQSEEQGKAELLQQAEAVHLAKEGDAQEKEQKKAFQDKEGRNSFEKTGPTWKIIFRGREISGLKGIGFLYLHYLMKNPTEELTAVELEDKLLPKSEAQIENEGECEEDISRTIERQRILDRKGTAKLVARIKELKNELAKAEREGDESVTREIRDELTKYKKQSYDSRHLFKDEISKAKNRVGQVIKRAIGTLQAEDSELGRHISNAFKKPFAVVLKYKPTEIIFWNFG